MDVATDRQLCVLITHITPEQFARSMQKPYARILFLNHINHCPRSACSVVQARYEADMRIFFQTLSKNERMRRELEIRQEIEALKATGILS